MPSRNRPSPHINHPLQSPPPPPPSHPPTVLVPPPLPTSPMLSLSVSLYRISLLTGPFFQILPFLPHTPSGSLICSCTIPTFHSFSSSPCPYYISSSCHDHCPEVSHLSLFYVPPTKSEPPPFLPKYPCATLTQTPSVPKHHPTALPS